MSQQARQYIRRFFTCGMVLVAVLFSIPRSHAQNQTKGKQPKKLIFHGSDMLYYDSDVLKAKRYIGSVHCEYEGTHFYCDSLYQYDNDDFDAFSNIRIIKGGDFTLTGEKLHFNNQTKVAEVRNKVVLRDKEMTLTTNYLNYNVDSEVGHYIGCGTIVSNQNKNTLTSDIGYYHSKIETFYFRRNVVLKNPDYVVKSDTMKYNSTSEISYFYGPTSITGDKTFIYCENGYYNAKLDQSRFGKNAKIISEKTILTGDSMYYDGKKEYGEVFRNVTIRDTTQNYIITGNYGRHEEKTKYSYVTDRAVLMQSFDSDTLFMHADSLKAYPDSLGNDAIYAYHRVKLFKNDLQGKCDSLVYSQADSVMKFFKSPVLWSGQSQITGDTLLLRMENDAMKELYVNNNSFIISDALSESDSIGEPSGLYNQIKGRYMTGHFQGNELHSLYVEGNGQLIYFPKEEKGEKKGTPPKPMGINNGECSNIYITIRNNELIRLRMETETNSKFAPIRLADKEKMELENFNWRGDERPRKMEDIFEW